MQGERCVASGVQRWLDFQKQRVQGFGCSLPVEVQLLELIDFGQESLSLGQLGFRFACSICVSLKPVPCADGCRIISLFLGGSGSFILPCKVSLIIFILKVSWLTTCSRINSQLVGELGFEPPHSGFTVCHNIRQLYLNYSTYHLPSYKVIIRLF